MEEKLKKATIEMYENTLMELKEKNVDSKVIELVESEKEETENVFKNDLLLNITVPPAPLFTDLFIVRYGNVPEWLVSSFSWDNKQIHIGYKECNGFSAEEYFLKNKIPKTLILEFLDKTGCVIRRDTFIGCKFVSVSGNSITYKTENILESFINLKYKKRNIEIIGGNKIKNGSTN